MASAQADPRIFSATLAEFGAKGDGIQDDSNLIRDAFARLPAGAILDGEGKLYRVAGTLNIRRDLTFRNASFQQIDTPEGREGPHAVRTLLIRGEPTRPIRVVLERIKIHRGVNPHQGSTNDAAGIWMDHVVDSRLSNIEISGNGRGYGLLLADASHVEVRNLHVHDMVWAPCVKQKEGLPWESIHRAWNSYQVVPMENCSAAGKQRERIQEPLTGVFVVRSRNIRLIDPVIERLQAVFADGRHIPWQTDGIHISTGSVDSSGKSIPSEIWIQGAKVAHVWNGIDIAGHPVKAVRVENAQVDDTHAFGIKVANGAVDVQIRRARVSNSGLAGFVVSGMNASTNPHPATHQVHIQDSQAINTGANGYWHGQATIAGFRVMRGRSGGPVGVRITRSQAWDEQKSPTMQFGFHAECRDALTLDQTSARGYILASRHIESSRCQAN